MTGGAADHKSYWRHHRTWVSLVHPPEIAGREEASHHRGCGFTEGRRSRICGLDDSPRPMEINRPRWEISIAPAWQLQYQ